MSDFSQSDFGAAFKGFMDQMANAAPKEVPFFRRRIADHIQGDPAKFAIVAETFPGSDHPNVQRALEAYLADGGELAAVLGVSASDSYLEPRLADLIATSTDRARDEGPVRYANVEVGDDTIACVQLGLFLIRRETPLAVLISGPRPNFGDDTVTVEVLAPSQEAGQKALARLRQLMRARNVYRGHVISLEPTPQDGIRVRFHHLPQIPREDLILPNGVLERVERHTVRFSEHTERLKAAGRHLKRGVLLHGPPGTGKTFTAMHLASRMRDRTVFLMTGPTQALLESTSRMARLLQPSTIILEDVDLIGEERTRPGTCTPMLFELLNQMDGLAEDADVLFILTTNRPDILEPALAARPGRVDLAVEVPLPNLQGRERLLTLYSRGLETDANLGAAAEKLEGTSGAFIKELMRKATLIAAEEGDAPRVSDKHMSEAIHDLLVEGGPLTRSLLGTRRE